MKVNYRKAELECLSTATLEQMSTSTWFEGTLRRIRIPHGLNAATVDRIHKILNHRDYVCRVKVKDLDYDARVLAAKAGIELDPNVLHVIVKDENTVVSFFCPACECKHIHGADSHLSKKAAHCFVGWSPYTGRGYTTVMENRCYTRPPLQPEAA